jgi:Pentapeptide repeats (8 copies)
MPYNSSCPRRKRSPCGHGGYRWDYGSGDGGSAWERCSSWLGWWHHPGAFVREHSHPTKTTEPDGSVAKLLAALLRGRSEPAEVPVPNPLPTVAATTGPTSLRSRSSQQPTQAALTVLGRLPQRSGVSRGDLSAALLPRTSLGGANRSGTVLHGANLIEAQFLKADLSGAELYRANLSGAGLNGGVG